MQTISTRSRIDRKSILLGSSALLVAMAVSGAAQAQCTSTIPQLATYTNGAGVQTPITGLQLLPLAQAGTVNSLVSVLNTTTTVFQAQTGSAFVSSPANAAPGENGGGIWGRVLGGEVETKNTGVTTLQLNGAAVAGSANCDTTTKQGFVGYQFGRDIAKLNWDGWNIHTGATVGYLASQSRDKTPGGTFSGGTQIPFVGTYLTATKGGFFADAMLRWDYYNMSLDDPSAAMFNQNLDARGWSIAANMGYNFALPNNWFIEPSAGFTYSRVTVDPLSVSGTLFSNLPGFSMPGTVQVDDIKSELGRVSVRLGTNIVTPTMAIQPFVTGSVFHEFAGDVTTRFAVGPAFSNALFGGPLTGSLVTDRVGTYGQVSGGLAGQVLNTGWVGYVRGDYRFGENIDGWTLNGGLRYQFTPEPLQAALSGKGIVYKAPPVAVAAPVVWRGFYVGVNGGTMWGKTDWNYVATPANIEPKFGGALLGGQVGYNFQFNQWVLGFEGDIAWANTQGTTPCPNANFYSCQTEMDWFATMTARLGYSWERTLFFVKGGLAVADVTQQSIYNLGGSGLAVTPNFVNNGVTTNFGSFAGPATGPVNGTSKIAAGWTAGVGAEYALNANWSAKAEWLYYSLGRDDYRTTVDINAKETGGLARVGLNYRFSPVPAVPVMAKY
ncbi:autotransporter domain-containing protein [Rhodoplanes elegans]|nr:autotransporter domain-containing protein [Rhodoplanes elegans]